MTHAPETRRHKSTTFSGLGFRRRFFEPLCVSGEKFSRKNKRNKVILYSVQQLCITLNRQ